MRRSQLSRQQSPWNNHRYLRWLGHYSHWLLVVGGVTLIGITFSIMPHDAEATRNDIPLAVSHTSTLTLAIPERLHTTPTTPPLQDNTANLSWTTVEVQSGDSLSALFARHGLSQQDVFRITANAEAAKHLKRIYPGDTLQLAIQDNKLSQLIYEFEIAKRLQLQREGDIFHARIVEQKLEHRITQSAGTIEDSLFLSAQKAGLSDRLTMELAGIFGWDIDFALDIRSGDSFAVLYEEHYLNGEKVRDGDIIAAEFTNRGTTYQAIHYGAHPDQNDYYAPNGKSMRKAFLRTPVEFSRISSRFNLKRKHPVLNKIRAHKGVDYAAPTGTPIRATGNGKVTLRGVKGGYGNTVIIQHGSAYSTLYAHMSRFARGISHGKRVKQGQIIGYVGQSGLATGPHLHYEFRVNGVHRNPLTVKLPTAKPLPQRYLADFQQHAKPLLSRLEVVKRTQLALTRIAQ